MQAQTPSLTLSINVEGTNYSVGVFSGKPSALASNPPEGYLALNQTDWWGKPGLAEDLATDSPEVDDLPIFYIYGYRENEPGVFESYYSEAGASATQYDGGVDQTRDYAMQAVPEIDGAALSQGVLVLAAVGLWGLGRRRACTAE
ncbi:hypothetical protein V6X63_10185 [Spiribacter sp. 221]|uniref:hypothetical protein n=1 Tax=Spiribacter onubensis TaxID=3122420 RepID=UPI00349FC83B